MHYRVIVVTLFVCLSVSLTSQTLYLPAGGRKGSGNRAYNISFLFPTNYGEQYFSMYSLWNIVCLHPVEL